MKKIKRLGMVVLIYAVIFGLICGFTMLAHGNGALYAGAVGMGMVCIFSFFASCKDAISGKEKPDDEEEKEEEQ